MGGAATKSNAIEKYVVGGPTCFFCQAIATCKVCVGDAFQCVCDECRSWRLREQKQSPNVNKKTIQPSRSSFLENRLSQNKITTKNSSALDFFVEGKMLSKVEQGKEVSTSITENSTNDTTDVKKIDQNYYVLNKKADDSNHNIDVQQDDIDDATKAMILAIQKQDQQELEQEKQLQRATDEASLAAIKAIQEQDAMEEQERIKQQKIENERVLRMKNEEEERERQLKMESDRLQIREEQMLLAAIQASQLEAQIQDEQFNEMQEPLSWKAPHGDGISSSSNNNSNNGNVSTNQETENFYVPALGERHCRQRCCTCMQFDEDITRPTICKCRHGEMYHRLDSEAPLARTNIPGIAKCVHCSKDIINGNGFSGWYNEVQGSNGKLVHVECWEQYKDTVSAKCVKCLQPLRRKEGLFSGRYKKLGDGKKCHKECFSQYKIDIGDFCDVCNEALLREYVILQDGSAGLEAHKDGKVYAHKDCWHRHLGGGGSNGHSNYKRTIINHLK